MPNMELIQAVTVGSGGASTISFTSIPQTYTDLVLKVSSRNTTGGTDNLRISFNGNTTSYSFRVLEGNGSSAGSFNDVVRLVGLTNSSTSTASTFSNNEIYIPNYTSSNNKSFLADAVTENNATIAYAQLWANLWSNSAAITSIDIDANTLTFAQYTTAYLYGVTNVLTGPKATGGNITFDGVYYYHTFLSSGTFTPTTALTADYVVVAGGGGSQGDRGGAGGAGGLRSTVTATGGGGSLETPLSLTAQAYTVTIGAGGTARTNGSNSVFSTITSTGGGAGGNVVGPTTNPAITGGSGGGGAGVPSQSGAAGTTNQGYAGGDGVEVGSGGGGGAGGVGANGTTAAGGAGGAGGSGVTISLFGSSVTYGGGGGGYGTNGAAGGIGGGGNGSTPAIGFNATNGTANTGGGAGGTHGTGGQSTNGGSGIVVVRYAK